ncbi:hypothetical protein KP509_1Z213200 [Ceratopteris richardii]|nr:hypothetical protein KP509_1Z213200 [Ceratopteris richardii]
MSQSSTLVSIYRNTYPVSNTDRFCVSSHFMDHWWSSGHYFKENDSKGVHINTKSCNPRLHISVHFAKVDVAMASYYNGSLKFL